MLDGGGERKHVVLKHGGEHSKEAREVRGVAVDIRLEAAKHGSKTPRQAMESMLREGLTLPTCRCTERCNPKGKSTWRRPGEYVVIHGC